MPLLDRSRMPPGGFPYREPAINWRVPTTDLYLPFDMVARTIAMARINNPHAGLNPDLNACRDALDLYTCTRLNNDPKWCVAVGDPVAIAIDQTRKAVHRCGGCGQRKVAK